MILIAQIPTLIGETLSFYILHLVDSEIKCYACFNFWQSMPVGTIYNIYEFLPLRGLHVCHF